MSNAAVAEPPQLAADCATLGLSTVAAHWARLATDATRRRQAAPEYLADLLSLEVAARRERRIQRRIAEAHFPVLKTLDTFDFAAQPGLVRDQVLDLAQGAFVREAGNIVLVGGVGTGKTHVASGLGLACCQREFRVRYTTAAELTNALCEAKHAGRLSRALERWARYHVVVLDELGYVPFDKPGAELLFGFITKVYERRSLIVTTNLPFAQWGSVFLDATAAAAVIDRIVHHATVLKTEGESYRLRAATKRRRASGAPA